MQTFTQVILYTDSDGYARFKEEEIALSEGDAVTALSSFMPAEGLQLRRSQVGFKSGFHCTGKPQWLFVLRGIMQITLQDGSSRQFKAGEHFYSADVLPEGAIFDNKIHGHSSCQIGDEVLETLFVRA